MYTVGGLTMDVASRNLNLQMQQLVADHKKTGEERLLLDAEILRAEFDTWEEQVPPAQL